MLCRSAVLLMLLAAPVIVSAQDQRPGAVVVVTGEGVVRAVPDRAWITISAETRATSPREAQRRNIEAMAPVQARLRGAGISPDAIRTTTYDLQQEWDFVNNRRVSRGYVARNSIEVRVDAIDRVGELLELAVESGATSVGGIRFDLKERPSHEREALRLAVADARAKADAAATGAGRSVERVVRVEEHGVATPPPVPFATVRELAQTADAPPVSPGEIELRAQVTITAELR
jgi:uncharacterized protein YggE